MVIVQTRLIPDCVDCGKQMRLVTTKVTWKPAPDGVTIYNFAYCPDFPCRYAEAWYE